MSLTKNAFTLLILAGGLGSRFQGSKQTEPVGPSGEFLLEYSIYDALRSGFNKIVVVVNRSCEESLAQRLASLVGSTELVFVEQQRFDPRYPNPRKKPWGTVHAVLSTRQVIQEPFAVVNADDFYGRATYERAAEFLSSPEVATDHLGMVAFPLSNTLSSFGPVSRAVCVVGADGALRSVVEHKAIERVDGSIRSKDTEATLPDQTLVSMNCWLLHPGVFDRFALFFDEFYVANRDSESAECYLPSVIEQDMRRNGTRVSVLRSEENWIGLTYPGDRTAARALLAERVSAGRYPSPLLAPKA